MSISAPTQKRPSPQPGIITNVNDLIQRGDSFNTIIGSVVLEEDPVPAQSIPWLPTLSLHYWHFKKGDEDNQRPHFQDELYMILEGEGAFELDPGHDFDIKPGDIIFVPAGQRHRFLKGTEDLRVLIFFGPDWSGQPAPQ